MKTNHIRLPLMLLSGSCAGLLVLSHASETASSAYKPTPLLSTSVPSSKGSVQGWRQVIYWPRTGVGVPPWTSVVHTIYLPETGNGWAGTAVEDRQVLIEDRILGVYYDAQHNRETLRLSVSTNRHVLHSDDVTAIMEAEFGCFTNGPCRLVGGPQYFIYLEKLIGPVSLRDYPDTNKTDGIYFFSTMTRPSKLKDVTVEGTNAVVSIECGTNVLARVALNKEVRPMWVTVNGKPINPIPTNTVIYVDVVGGREVTKVVY